MLKRRLIAKLLVDPSGVLVKFRHFTEARRVAGNPVSTARILEDQRVDEFNLTFIDVADPGLVRQMTTELFTPVTVAGSIRTVEQVDVLIQESGADKVVVKSLTLAEMVARKYGNQAVVWPIDYRDVCTSVAPDCAGEVLLTSIDRDGMGCGFDLAALGLGWKVPVVLAGGCGRLSHVKAAFDAGADAVGISSMFFFSDKSPIKLRSYLISEGLNIRAA